jgi:hypothetical protein
MTTRDAVDALTRRIVNASSLVLTDDREHVRRLLGSIRLSELARIVECCSGNSSAADDFLARMAVAAYKNEGISKATGVSDFLLFAAEIAPIAVHFGPMSPFSVDRWLYMSTVITKQRGNAVAPNDLVSYHRGLALTLFVDQQSVNGRPESDELVWLGSQWNALESYVPLLIERSSVERSFVESLVDGTNGLPTMSKGIL